MADTTSALVVSAVSRCARSMLGPGRAIKLCTPDLDSASGGVEAMPVAAFDGSGLLKVLSVKHPAVMLLYESVKGQDNEAGCSSTLLLSLVGPLMDRLVVPFLCPIHPIPCHLPCPPFIYPLVQTPAVCTLATCCTASSSCPLPRQEPIQHVPPLPLRCVPLAPPGR